MISRVLEEEREHTDAPTHRVLTHTRINSVGGGSVCVVVLSCCRVVLWCVVVGGRRIELRAYELYPGR